MALLPGVAQIQTHSFEWECISVSPLLPSLGSHLYQLILTDDNRNEIGEMDFPQLTDVGHRIWVRRLAIIKDADFLNVRHVDSVEHFH